MIILVGILAIISIVVVCFAVSRYKLCPPNQALVVYGATSTKGDTVAKCIHGGGTFVWPLIQNSRFLPLKPLTVDIELKEALSHNNIRMDIPAAITFAISPEPAMLQKAALRLLGMDENQITVKAREIIVGQMRAVIASMTIEEINKDREKFLQAIETHITSELAKLGLCVINTNIINISDESGYIIATGKRAAAEAVNQANIDVATQEQLGATGVANALKQKEINVAEAAAEKAIGTANANKQEQIGVAEAAKETALAVADQQAVQAEGENKSKVRIAKAQQEGQVAEANASKLILEAEAARETARLQKDEVVKQEIEKQKAKVIAEAKAVTIETEAKANSNAILMKYEAEAEGQKKILVAQAEGLKSIVDACGGDASLANGYLMLDKIPELVATQVKALENIKIDKLVVWDSGKGGDGNGGVVSNIAKDLIGSIPQLNDLMEAAGIQMPNLFGKVGGVSPKTTLGAPTPKVQTKLKPEDIRTIDQ